MADDEVKFLEVRGRSCFQPRLVAIRRVFVLLQLSPDVLAQFVLPFQRQRDQFVPDRAWLLSEKRLRVDAHHLRLLKLFAPYEVTAERRGDFLH